MLAQVFIAATTKCYISHDLCAKICETKLFKLHPFSHGIKLKVCIKIKQLIVLKK